VISAEIFFLFRRYMSIFRKTTCVQAQQYLMHLGKVLLYYNSHRAEW
jgi:hypothetical protein